MQIVIFIKFIALLVNNGKAAYINKGLLVLAGTTIAKVYNSITRRLRPYY
jgi:hypothetical protein